MIGVLKFDPYPDFSEDSFTIDFWKQLVAPFWVHYFIVPVDLSHCHVTWPWRRRRLLAEPILAMDLGDLLQLPVEGTRELQA